MHKLKLRSKQVKTLLTSSLFASSKLMEESIYKSYSSKKDLDHYQSIAFDGLVPCEEPVLKRMQQRQAQVGNDRKLGNRVLVIGCGSGREAFAFAKHGLKVYAMDIVPEMIELAQTCAQKQNESIHFFAAAFPTLNDLEEAPVDFIYVSSFVINFLQGEQNRVHYMAKLSHLLKAGGEIYLCPSIEKISFGSLEFYSSSLMRLNSWIKGWNFEKGDHAISTYHGDGELMYFHHYPSEDDFFREVQQAGYAIAPISEDFYRLSQLNHSH